MVFCGLTQLIFPFSCNTFFLLNIYFINLLDYFYLFIYCGFFFSFYFCNQDIEINKGVGVCVGVRLCVAKRNVKTFIYGL